LLLICIIYLFIYLFFIINALLKTEHFDTYKQYKQSIKTRRHYDTEYIKRGDNERNVTLFNNSLKEKKSKRRRKRKGVDVRVCLC